MNTTRTLRVVGVLAAVSFVAAVAIAQNGGLALARVRPDGLQFAKMPNGTSQANVIGEIAKAGPYAVRTILPAGLRLQPHFHPEDRVVLVVSGTLSVGYGERWDDAKLVALPAGSVFTEPAKQPHFAFAVNGDVVLHVTGNGPSATTWVTQGPQ
jgi:quercetin dioxygenase-like cupin family protein